MAHVIIIALGPIQDFIAAARRCRDLWFGSWLLSELSKATAAAIAEEHGAGALIFPGVEDLQALRGGSGTAVANKIVARVGGDPKDVAQRAEAAMRRRLRAVRERAFGRVRELPGTTHFGRGAAEAQIDDLIEYVWASAPEADGPDAYAAARRQAEALLSARKHTHLWAPVTWGAEVPKSSIDGARESVLHEDLYDGIPGRWTAEEVRVRYGVGASERLCGVGLLKRHGTREGSRYGHHFLSTGHLAAWPLFERVERLADAGPLHAAWRRYLDLLTSLGVDLEPLEVPDDRAGQHAALGPYDGSLLFEGRLVELFEDEPEPAARRAKAQRARGALAEVLKELGVATPLPYYAILLADGDRMGRVIDRQRTPEEHRRLSQALDGFAGNARRLVETVHRGELIYSGGDDVLAFVPLHRAVACARALAEDFEARLRPLAQEDGPVPSLSVGIGISHFMEPMGHALDLARRAEKLAKQTRGALAVIVDKRSGPAVAVSGPWGTIDRDLDDFVAMHRSDLVPDGAAFELRELERLLAGAEDEAKATLESLARKEAERILRRKQPAHGAEAELAEEVLARLLASLAQATPGMLAERLIVARLLVEAEQEATPELPGGPS